MIPDRLLVISALFESGQPRRGLTAMSPVAVITRLLPPWLCPAAGLLDNWCHWHYIKLSSRRMVMVVLDRVKVVSDEEVMSGDPCIEGTRIPVETVLLNLRAGHSLDRIFQAYPTLPPGGIEAAIRWAEAHGIEWRR